GFSKLGAQIFDLALTKKVDPLSFQNAGYQWDDDDEVRFIFEVFNQGTVMARNIVIRDTIPYGLRALGSPGWSVVSTIGCAPCGGPIRMSAEFTIDSILPGESFVFTG